MQTVLCSLIIALFALKDSHGQECSEGYCWYTSEAKCWKKCHCNNSITCDRDTCECPAGDTCAFEFTGPGCQFIDTMQTIKNDPGVSIPSFVSDGDDGTCNPNKKSSKLDITLNATYLYSWIRIVTSAGQINSKFNFNYSVIGYVKCWTNLAYYLNDRVLEIICNRNYYKQGFKEMHIEGDIVPYICTISIVSGRNMALMIQSRFLITNTTETIDGKPMKASYGTDGKIGEGHPCARTTLSAYPMYIVSMFDHGHTVGWFITLIRYYRDAGVDDDRDLTLELWMETKVHYVLPRKMSQKGKPARVDFFMEPLGLASSLYVTNKNPDAVIGICEMEIYATKPCNRSSYGLVCSQNCSCSDPDLCHPTTGACAQCRQGLWGGETCSRTCSSTCQAGCDIITGECFGCLPGFTGNQCDRNCPSLTFGQNCFGNCSLNCADNCDHITGLCNCSFPEYQTPPLCEGTTPIPNKEWTDEAAISLAWVVGGLTLFALVPLILLLIFCCIKRHTKAPETEVQPKRAVVGKAGDKITEPEDIQVTGSSVDIRPSGSLISESEANVGTDLT